MDGAFDRYGHHTLVRNIAADWPVRTLRAPLPPLRRGRPDLEHHGHNAGILAHDPPCLALPSMDEVNEQARDRGSSRVSLTRRALGDGGRI